MKPSRKNRLAPPFWVYFVSQRLTHADGRGKAGITGMLSSLGICFGVMTLIVTVSVMNGFQSGFINSIMEISSAHIQVRPGEGFDGEAFLSACRSDSRIAAAFPFYEAQALMAGTGGRQAAAVIRALPSNILELDKGFAREVPLTAGSFSLAESGSAVLGWSLARSLGIRPGHPVSLLALSGGSDVELFSEDRQCTVSGLFRSGYGDINSSFAFISLETGKEFLGKDACPIYAVKLVRPEDDARVAARLAGLIPNAEYESWRSYNRSFFGALRIEKNLLMMLVFLIFVVVGVNIYNSMRRMVYERREEIAVLSALGGTKKDVQTVFVVRGAVMGICGALPGLLLGLMICVQMDSVFLLLSKLSYGAQLVLYGLAAPEMAAYVQENPMFKVYASIPARMYPHEIVLITMFGVFSALAAAWAASRRVLNLSAVEVLHDE